MKDICYLLIFVITIGSSSCSKTQEKSKNTEEAEALIELDTTTVETESQLVETVVETQEESSSVIFEQTFDSLRFTIEEKDLDLLVRAYDSLDTLIDELSIKHPYYMNSLFGNTSFEIIQKLESSVHLMFYSQYGGDGEHTRETAKIIFFDMSELELKDEIVIFEPDISTYEGRASITGYYIISLCDVCDGWGVADEEDVFKIPMNIEIAEDVKYYAIMNGEERDFVIKDFETKVQRKIDYHLSKNDSSIFRLTDQAKTEFYRLVNK